MPNCLRLIFSMQDPCLVLVQSQHVFDQNHRLNLQHKVKCRYTTGGAGRCIHAALEKSYVSSPFAHESPDMGQTERPIFFVCLF